MNRKVIKAKKIKTDVLEDMVILDGKEYPSTMFLDDFEDTASIDDVDESFLKHQGNYREYRFNTVRFPDKIEGEWIDTIFDAELSFQLFAGWREYYSDDYNAGQIYYTFDKVILPRRLKKISDLAFGYKDYDVVNTPELFISSEEDEGEVDIEQFVQ